MLRHIPFSWKNGGFYMSARSPPGSEDHARSHYRHPIRDAEGVITMKLLDMHRYQRGAAMGAMVAAIAAISVAGAPSARAGGNYQLTQDAVNVRSGPTTSDPVVGR